MLYAFFLPSFVFAKAPDSFDFFVVVVVIIIFVCSTLLDKTDELLPRNPFYFQIMTITMPLAWALLKPEFITSSSHSWQPSIKCNVA